MKSSKQVADGKRAGDDAKRKTPRVARNGARGNPKGKGSRRLRIVGGTGRIPDEILDTPGPSCPGAVELLLADRTR